MQAYTFIFTIIYIQNVKCTYILVYIYAHKYIYHLRTRTYKYIYIYITCIFIYIYIVYIIYLCFDNWNSLDGECSIALSQTVGQSLRRSLIMAQEQKSTRRKEEKAPKNTSCPRAARPVSLPEGNHKFIGIHMDWSLPMESLHPDVTYPDHIPNYPVCSFIKGSSTLVVLNDFTH